MKKIVSTIILATFTAVCSFGAAAADTGKSSSTTGNSASKEKWEKRYGEGGRGNESTSEIMKDKEPKDLSPEEKYEYRDQEVMNKKPYKEKK